MWNTLGIQSRAVLFAVGLVVVSVAMTAAMSYWTLNNELIRKQERELGQVAKVTSAHFGLKLQRLREDALTLSARATGNPLLTPDSGTVEVWSALANAQKQMLIAHPDYRQVLLIGLEGPPRRLLGFERAHDALIETPPGPADQAILSSYLRQVAGLSAGEAALSEVLRDSLEGAEGGTELVSCAVAPVFDAGGRLIGLVVLKAELTSMLELLEHLARGSEALFVADEQGRLLYPPDTDASGVSGLPRAARLQDEFPGLDARFAQGSIESSTVVVKNREGRMAVLGIHALDAGLDHRLQFVHASFYSDIVAAATISPVQTAAFTALMIIVAVPLALYFSIAITRPLNKVTRAIIAYRPGKADAPLPVHRRDEIGALARAFDRQVQAAERRRKMLLAEDAERRKVEARLGELAAAVEHTADCIAILDRECAFRYVNPAYLRKRGYALSELIGRKPWELPHRKDSGDEYRRLWQLVAQGSAWSGRLTTRLPNGRVLEEDTTVSPVTDRAGKVILFVAVIRDITERVCLERQLHQAQKLESVGQLAAGIAHEINTPTQYVGDNMQFLKSAFASLMNVADSGAGLLDQVRAGRVPDEAREQAEATFRKARLEFLRDEVPGALEQSVDGLERIARIIGAMREFSHPAREKTLLNVNRAIETTLTVTTSEWKYVADLCTEFDPELPAVPCLPGEFNQVIMNVVVNAARAIADAVGDSGDRGVISVTTARVEDGVEICISDTGVGMPEEVQARIFDPFYTTRGVGEGIGQGLSIAYTVIVEKHGGSIEVDSAVGRGTTLTIRLPLCGHDADLARTVVA